MDIQQILSILDTQEKTFQVSSLSNWDCLEIGNALAKEVKNSTRPVAIIIYKEDILVFSYTMKGKEKSHYEWIIKKLKLARRANMSSFQAKIRLHYLHEFEKLQKDERYAFGAGAFPIRNPEGKVLAWIGVSGLQEPEDHFLIINTLEKWMKKKAPALPEIFKKFELPALEQLKEIEL